MKFELSHAINNMEIMNRKKKGYNGMVRVITAIMDEGGVREM